MATYPIETERLIIRPVQENDAGAIATLVTPSISRWTATWPPFISGKPLRKSRDFHQTISMLPNCAICANVVSHKSR